MATVTYLICAGGAGGGQGGASGGGGGGGVLTGSDTITSGTLAVVVGGGGGPNGNGGNSSFNGHTAVGGGAGGSTDAGTAGQNGGCGGGGQQDGGFQSGGSGSQGGGGGTGTGVSGGGGGGAAGGTGGAGGSDGGNGAAGTPSSITGASHQYGSGGGGGSAGNRGVGGTGAGDGGSTLDGSGRAGKNATFYGCGGGGDAGTSVGGSGYQGIVVLTYPTGSLDAVGGTKDTTTIPGTTIHIFTAVGTTNFLIRVVITPPVGSATTSGVSLSLQLGAGTQPGTITADGLSPGLQWRVEAPGNVLSLTGFASTIIASLTKAPPAGTLAVNGIAPGNRFQVLTFPGAETYSTWNPTSVLGVGVPKASITITGNAQQFLKGPYFKPGAGTFVISGIAPSLRSQLNIPLAEVVFVGLPTTGNVSQGPIALPPFSQWSLTGCTLSSNGVITFSAYGQKAVSPPIFVDTAIQFTFGLDFFGTTQSPYVPFHPNAGSNIAFSYVDSVRNPTPNIDGLTTQMNNQSFPVNTWSRVTWPGFFGGAVRYVVITISPDATYTTAALQVQQPQLLVTELSTLKPRLTQVVGSFYNAATLQKITSGQLIVRPASLITTEGSDYISTTFTRIQVPNSGVIYTQLAPTEDGEYIIEYDPDPDDTDTPLTLKSGYFVNQWTIPTSSVPIDIAVL